MVLITFMEVSWSCGIRWFLALAMGVAGVIGAVVSYTCRRKSMDELSQDLANRMYVELTANTCVVERRICKSQRELKSVTDSSCS